MENSNERISREMIKIKIDREDRRKLDNSKEMECVSWEGMAENSDTQRFYAKLETDVETATESFRRNL